MGTMAVKPIEEDSERRQSKAVVTRKGKVTPISVAPISNNESFKTVMCESYEGASQVIPKSTVMCANLGESSNIETAETILDSKYYKEWLPQEECHDLIEHLISYGKEKISQFSNKNLTKKYPLLSCYFGERRPIDGARALDRWGSDYESWLRVEEPTNNIKSCCNRIRNYFNLSNESVNSIVVNYYTNGESMYIPAHSDTTTCLQENSSIFSLSLGATRSFILCDNNDVGKYDKQDLTIYREWRVGPGDMIRLGPQTNKTYCHTIPKDNNITTLRISLIFRTINKSFMQPISSMKKEVMYADNTRKMIQGYSLITNHYNDIGITEHIGDLIQIRENKIRKREIESKMREKEKEKEKEDQIVSPPPTSSLTSFTSLSLTKNNSVTPITTTSSTTPTPLSTSSTVASSLFESKDDLVKYYMGEADTTKLQIMSSDMSVHDVL
mmetsp:Transcript_9932/g.10036  ORF Transcript_9932/g.10036 Transcript_9932/m.10036 type:complete len:441 (+) Transcript_9932:206-1528(+)